MQGWLFVNEIEQCAGVFILIEIMKHGKRGSSELQTMQKQCKIDQQFMNSYSGRLEGLQ